MHILAMMAPLVEGLSTKHFLVFWIGGEERSFPVVMGRDFFEEEKLELFAYKRFSGSSLCELFTECRFLITRDVPEQFNSSAERLLHYNIKTAQLVWNMVGEAQVPTAANGTM